MQGPDYCFCLVPPSPHLYSHVPLVGSLTAFVTLMPLTVEKCGFSLEVRELVADKTRGAFLSRWQGVFVTEVAAARILKGGTSAHPLSSASSDVRELNSLWAAACSAKGVMKR